LLLKVSGKDAESFWKVCSEGFRKVSSEGCGQRLQLKVCGSKVSRKVAAESFLGRFPESFLGRFPESFLEGFLERFSKSFLGKFPKSFLEGFLGRFLESLLESFLGKLQELKDAAGAIEHSTHERILAKSTPTSTKFLPDDHTKVVRLSLRDHRPKPSQSLGNSDYTKNAEKSPKMKFARFLRALLN
jgi:hypothetical protein